MRLRELAKENYRLLDPVDPLRPYNRMIARAFTYRRLKQVATLLRSGPTDGQPQTPRIPRPQLRLIPTDEGHLLKTQAQFIERLMHRHRWVGNVAEIGFNAGHSSYLFLAARPDVRVVAFDIGDHDYIDLAKEIIDRVFPGRHELIKGDSRQTVPAFTSEHPDCRFDLIFIDGGHKYEVAMADLENCQGLSTPRSLVLMDDLQPSRDYGVGPVKAWHEAQANGLVKEELLVEDGFPLIDLTVDDVAPESFVWGIGKYAHPGE